MFDVRTLTGGVLRQKVAFLIPRQRAAGRSVAILDRRHEAVVFAFTKFPKRVSALPLTTALRG